MKSTFVERNAQGDIILAVVPIVQKTPRNWAIPLWERSGNEAMKMLLDTRFTQ
jgi:hypothetical protein